MQEKNAEVRILKFNLRQISLTKAMSKAQKEGCSFSKQRGKH
jgi:hypothetical protein